MASLESFAGAGVTATRNAGSQEITITGGLLQITGYLDANTVPPGYRIRCSGGGGLAFNCPDATATEITISSRVGAAILLGNGFANLIDGDAIEKDGDLGDLDNATVYYVEKGSANTIYLHATRPQALAGQSGTRISAGTGAVPADDGGVTLAAGRRDIGIIGDLDGAQVSLLEEDDAFAFKGDNYNDATEISRFQAGKITLRNLYFESLRPNGSDNASRSDFDIAPGAEPVFEDCILSTLSRYNHLAGANIRIDGLTFRNNTAAVNDWAFEFTGSPSTTPQRLTIEPANRSVAVLGVFLTDGVPAKFADLAGISQFQIGNFNPNGQSLTEAQINEKIVYLVNPAGDPAKRGSGGPGQLEIRRSVTLDFGAEVAATEGSCRLIPKSSNAPYTEDILHADATGPHNFAETLSKRAAGGDQAYTDYNSYRYLKVSPHYRKASGDFTVASQASAGATQTITAALTRETYPNGSHFALSASAPASVADLDDLFEAIKRHEIANPKDGGEQVSLAVINADGYIELADGFSLAFDASATQLTAWAAATETLTVKASATVAASANGLLGVQVSGSGAITSTGADVTAFLSKTASAQNSILAAAAAEAGVFLGLYGADGALIGSATTAAGSLSATFTATAAQSAAGCRLLASKVGFEPQVREIDLSAGGSRSETFGPLAQIQQFDGSASYDSAKVSSASRTVFNVSNLSDVKATVEVANESLSALEFFATFASAAASTANGRKYLAFGGTQPTALALFSGDLISLPASVRIKRRASGNTSATVAASVIAGDGQTILDESNGSVQLTGGISLADFQQAIFANFDLDPEEAGTQSLAAKLLALGAVASQNATAIAALPSAAENAAQILGSATAVGGDTVKQALARNRSLASDILGAEVASGGDTAKQALARISALPAASDIRDALLAAGISGSTPLSKVLEVLFAVLAGTATRTGDSTAFSDADGTTIISATTDNSGNRTEVSIP